MRMQTVPKKHIVRKFSLPQLMNDSYRSTLLNGVCFFAQIVKHFKCEHAQRGNDGNNVASPAFSFDAFEYL